MTTKASSALGELPSDPLFNVQQAGEYTGTTERLWRRLIDERRVEFTRVGKYVRVRKSVIDEYLVRNTVEPVPRRSRR